VLADLDSLDAVFEQDVAGLYVAMDQARFVGSRESGGGLAANAEDVFQLERAFAIDFVLERLALDELHDEIRWLMRIIDGVDGDDVLVMHGRGGRRFAKEPLDGDGIGRELGRHHLYGYDAAELGVEGPQDGAHSAVANDFDDFVFAGLADELADAAWLVARL
jgi:hypothetical protein